MPNKERAITNVLEAIDESTLLEHVQELVRRPSVNPPGDYEAVTAYVLDAIHDLGLEVSTTECHSGRTNVVGRLRGKGEGQSLCLASHTDVVGIGEASRWQRDPFAADVIDGTVTGRGVADSKGMLAGMLAAVEGLQKANIGLQGDLYLVAYVDDETAGPCGLRDAYREGLVEADYLVLGEATNFEIQHTFKARLWFSVEVLGRSSHGAFPERGVNAIDKAYKIISAIQHMPLQEHSRLGKDTVSVGMIQGGEQVNVVPGRCRVWFDIRFTPPRTSENIREAVNEALHTVETSDPDFSLEEIEVTEERDPLEFEEDSPLNAAIRSAGLAALGREPGLGGWYSSGELWPVWKQGKLRHGAVIGPGEPWQAHAYDEQIAVEDLVGGARLYALTALNVCGR